MAIAIPAQLEEDIHETVGLAKQIRITTPAQYEGLAPQLKRVKTLLGRVVDFFKPMKQSADDAKQKILDAEKLMLAPLQQAEVLMKKAMLDYQREQAAQAEHERRRLQAEADQLARKERERLEKEAARLKTPEKKEERLEQAVAVVTPVIHVPSAVPKVSGVSFRRSWAVASVDKAALILAAAQNANLDVYLTVDMTALRKVGNATKGELNIPGVTWKEEQTMAVGAER